MSYECVQPENSSTIILPPKLGKLLAQFTFYSLQGVKF